MTVPKLALEDQLLAFANELDSPLPPLTAARARAMLKELEAMQRAATSSAELATIFGLKGRCLGFLEQRHEALDALKNAARYAPNSAEAISNVATMLLDTDQPEEALKFTQKARKMPEASNVERFFASLTEAQIWVRLKDMTRAAALFESAIPMVQNEPPARRPRFLFALAGNAVGLDRVHDAAEFLARFLDAAHGSERHPDEPALAAIARHRQAAEAIFQNFPQLGSAINRVIDEWNAPTDEDELGYRTHVKLDAEAWDSFCRLTGSHAQGA